MGSGEDSGLVVSRGAYESILKNEPQGILAELVNSYNESHEHDESEEEEEEVEDEIEEIYEEGDREGRGSRSSRRSSKDEKRIMVRTKSEIERSNKKAGALMSVEDRNTGDVPWKFYDIWFSAMGNKCFMIFAAFMFLISQSIPVMSTWWLSYWGQQGKEQAEDNPSAAHHTQMFYVYVYGALSLAYGIAVWIRTVTMLSGGLNA